MRSTVSGDASMPAHPGYLKDYIRELWRASYRALERIDTLVVLAIIVIGLSGAALEHLHGHPPWWLIGLTLLALVVFAFLRVPYLLYVKYRRAFEELERRLTSDLTVQPPEIALAHHGSNPAAYVRVPVLNAGAQAAKRCSARLTKVSRRDARGSRDLQYRDTLDFGWSNKPPGTREIDIGPNLTEWFDVAVTEQGARTLYLATIVRPNTYKHLMTVAGTYVFTIELSSEDNGQQTFQVAVDYGLNVNSLRVPNDALTLLSKR
jgi:hypothetical protein